MLKLNKKTEYALLALKHLSASVDGRPVPARTIAVHYGIPEMTLAKVLQVLKRAGILGSIKGVAGGYQLQRSLADVGVTELFQLFEEPMALIECVDHHDSCRQAVACDIKAPMVALNAAIHALLEGMTVAHLLQAPPMAPVAQLSIYRS